MINPKIARPGRQKRKLSNRSTPAAPKSATASTQDPPTARRKPARRHPQHPQHVRMRVLKMLALTQPRHKAPGLSYQPDRARDHTTLRTWKTQIAAEARGVTRKNIPWDKFCSIYLCDFSVKAQPKLAVKSVKKIGEGNWEEKRFWDRLRQSLSDEVRCSGCTFIRLSVLC